MGKLLNSLLLIAIFLVSCKQVINKKQENISFKDSIIVDNQDKKKKEFKDRPLDVLHYDSLLLKSKNLNLKLKALEKVWGKPDSISQYIAECGYLEGKEVKEYFYKKMIFIVYDNESELNEIDFINSNYTISHPKILLNSKTSLEEIKIKFPNSYYMREKSKENDKSYDIVRLKPHENWDGHVILTFVNQKLASLSFWNPC